MVNIETIKMLKSIKINDQANEEETKNKLVIPFLQALGYSFFNDTIQPEFSIGVGNQKVDRIDYLLTNINNENIIVECKRIGTNLENYIGQLSKYYMYLRSNNAKVKVAILTDGTEFRFFSDTKLVNIMDTEPFYTFNIHKRSIDPEDEMVLEKYSYTSMSAEEEKEWNHKKELLMPLGLDSNNYFMSELTYNQLVELNLEEKCKTLRKIGMCTHELGISDFGLDYIRYCHNSESIKYLKISNEAFENLRLLDKYTLLKEMHIKDSMRLDYYNKSYEHIENMYKSYIEEQQQIEEARNQRKIEAHRQRELKEQRKEEQRQRQQKFDYLYSIRLSNFKFLYDYSSEELKGLRLEEKVQIMDIIYNEGCELTNIQEFLTMSDKEFKEYKIQFNNWKMQRDQEQEKQKRSACIKNILCIFLGITLLLLILVVVL